MLNLSDVTSFYIEHKFINEMKTLVLDAFSLMEDFQLNFYEDKYIETINRYETMSDDDIYTVFNNLLVKDILAIIEAHEVTIDTDGQPSLADLVEVARGLLLTANLEDYSYVRYRVSTEQPPRATLLDLLERYTMLSRLRLMEIIGEVKESLVESLEKLTEDVSDEENSINESHRKYVARFFKYIEGIKCLGLELKEKGYGITSTLEELLSLQTTDMVSHTEKTATTDLAQAALDILSLLVYTTDEYNLPVFKFKKNSHLFTSDSNLAMRLNNALLAMMNDFTVFLSVCDQEEKANAN